MKNLKNIKSIIPWRKKPSALAVDSGDPFDVIVSLRRQVNGLFDSVFNGRSDWPAWPVGGFGKEPLFEVAETDKAVEVTAELPGMDEKDVQVTLDGNLLCVCGEKRAEKTQARKNYHVSELSYGRFERVVPLPAEVESGKAKAVFKRGVLRLTLPKTANAKSSAKRIAISVE